MLIKRLLPFLVLLVLSVVVVAACALGLVWVLAVGAAIYFGLNPPQGWRELPEPPEATVEVAAADEVRVTVRAASGVYYRRTVGATSAAWEAVERPAERMTGRGVETTAPPALDPPDSSSPSPSSPPCSG